MLRRDTINKEYEKETETCIALEVTKLTLCCCCCFIMLETANDDGSLLRIRRSCHCELGFNPKLFGLANVKSVGFCCAQIRIGILYYSDVRSRCTVLRVKFDCSRDSAVLRAGLQFVYEREKIHCLHERLLCDVNFLLRTDFVRISRNTRAVKMEIKRAQT